MSHSLSSLKRVIYGVLQGNIVGLVKGADTRSLDKSSNGSHFIGSFIAALNPRPGFQASQRFQTDPSNLSSTWDFVKLHFIFEYGSLSWGSCYTAGP